MSLKDRILGTSEARTAHRAAQDDLADATADAIANHGGEQTDAYIEANNRVVVTEQALPRWRRQS